MNESSLPPCNPVDLLKRLVEFAKDNSTLNENLHALESLVRSAIDNPALREPIKYRLQSSLQSISGQSLLIPLELISEDRCRFCDPRAVIERYDEKDFANERICASCVDLVAAKSKDQLAERVVQAYFRGHPHYPQNEGTRKLVRETIVEPDHKEFWQWTESEQGSQLYHATTPGDGEHVSHQSQGLSLIQSPQKRVLASVTCIHDRRTVLLVGEHKGVTKMLKERFEHEGLLVRSACDAENGFRVYESSGPFVLVMVDFSLPKNGGIELARTVRKNDPSQKIVITDFAARIPQDFECSPELMDVPILTEVHQLSNLFDSLRPWANREDVLRAIEGLSQADLCRVRKVAELKGCRDWEDLLHEALLRALIGADDPSAGKCKGKQRWDKRVDFVTFLIGSMRGINFHNKEKSRKLESLDPASDFASRERRADERLLDEADLAEILRRFHDDPEATEVLQDLACGMDKHEIKSKRSLSERQFATIMRHIRSKLSGRNDNKKGEEHDRQ